MNRSISTRILSVIALCFVGLACSDSADSDADGRRGTASVPAVEVVRAQFGSLPLEYRVSGTVRSTNQVAIYPEISAPVVSVAVNTGDSVKEGDALVYLRDTQLSEQLQQAEAALRVTEAEAREADAVLREVKSRLDRTRQLAAKQFQSDQALESLSADVAAAEASQARAYARVIQDEAVVNERREELRKTIIRAPVTGSVGRRNVEVGMRVNPNSMLFVIGSLDMMRVEISVPDDMVGQIRAGQTVVIRSRALADSVIYSQISRISPFIEPGSFSAAAEIDVEAGEHGLRPGMFVTVDVLYGESVQATLVPTSALYEDPTTGELGIVTAPSLGLEIPVEVPESYDPDSPPTLLEATPMRFQPIEVLARGSGAAGVLGIDPDTWVVVVGHHLLDGIAAEQVSARTRTLTWERVNTLQDLQDEDLLRQFMAKQQRLSREVPDMESADADSIDGAASTGSGTSTD